ncbi:hypothetical protein [Mobilicoccus pelagius]|uniref:Secreted protein n=1 Tax=Mobilicoccus pelagius NBRC 104925 TaxID=1089455 RepID=H5UP33_9MICO|nr:hypothetical protein [Mobilicoccus pelagius]GAB47491.1 hypothetical protein MOPEL_013_00320 [Mobilicoccus pelagius NBRC 104925]
MRAHRILATGLVALLLAGPATVAGEAEAATQRSTTTTTTTATTTATTASRYRVVRAAKVRRHAARPAPSTLTSITRAVHRSEYTAGVPASSYSVTGLRTSGSWARVVLAPHRPADLDAATVVLRRTKGQWRVVDLGTYGVGCDVTSAATQKALRLECD